MDVLKKICYHEATILDIKRKNNDLQLLLGDVDYNDLKVNVLIDCHEVKKILIENNEDESQLIYGKDAEILTLEIHDKFLDLIADWYDFTVHKSVVKSYHIEYDKIDLNLV